MNKNKISSELLNGFENMQKLVLPKNVEKLPEDIHIICSDFEEITD